MFKFRYVTLFLSIVLLIAACNPADVNHTADNLDKQISGSINQATQIADRLSADETIASLDKIAGSVNQTVDDLTNLKLPNPLEGWEMPRLPDRKPGEPAPTPPKSGALAFAFDFEPTVSGEYQDIVRSAGQFWSDRIKTQQTIVIQVSGEEGGGQWLAKAAPRQIGSNGLPIEGRAILNLSFAQKFSTKPEYFKSVVAHEIGHVLGIGTLWHPLNLVDDESATYRPDSEAGKTYGGAVPVEPQVLAHWDEDKFGAELMTPIAQDAGMFLGDITLATLKDIGWQL